LRCEMKCTERHNCALSPDIAPLAHSINLDPIGSDMKVA
jgi:hypothetical protein